MRPIYCKRRFLDETIKYPKGIRCDRTLVERAAFCLKEERHKRYREQFYRRQHFYLRDHERRCLSYLVSRKERVCAFLKMAEAMTREANEGLLVVGLRADGVSEEDIKEILKLI